MNKYTILIEEYFKKYGDNLRTCKYAVVRKDGIVLHSNTDSNEAATIGALASGVWQASESLTQLFEKDNGVYRMSFDTSSRGVYILPVKTKEDEFYFSCIYRKVTNPAKLKRLLQMHRANLLSFLDENEVMKSEVKTKYLFDDITDDEIDHLFSFAEAE